MAIWAQVDESNIVTNVVVTNNEDPAGDEGYSFLVEVLGGSWLQASFNTYRGVHSLGGTPFRKNCPSVGYTYDSERDAFYAPKPYESWIFDEDGCFWKAPVDYPANAGEDSYYWNDEEVSWVKIEL